MSLYKIEFSDYDDTLYCPDGFEDVSYHNDTMPHVRKEMKLGDKDIEINIWQDYKDIDKREYDNTKRYVFSIVVDGEIADEYQTDDINDIKRYVSDLDKIVNSVLYKMNENKVVASVVSKILEGADIRDTLGGANRTGVYEAFSEEFKQEIRNNPVNKKIKQIANKYGYNAGETFLYWYGGIHCTITSKDYNDYHPDVYVDNDLSDSETIEFSIQTVSYGSLNLDEYSEFISCCNDAYNMMQELSKLNFSKLAKEPKKD